MTQDKAYIYEPNRYTRTSTRLLLLKKSSHKLSALTVIKDPHLLTSWPLEELYTQRYTSLYLDLRNTMHTRRADDGSYSVAQAGTLRVGPYSDEFHRLIQI